MPPIQHLNPPPNPFWDFVVDMRDHPFFAAYAPQERPGQARGADATTPAPDAGTAAGNAQQPQQQQANVEDPPEVDPATMREENEKAREDRAGHCCGRRRRCGGSDSDEDGEGRRGCHGRRGFGRRGGWGGPGVFGPGFPFGGAGGPPFWARANGGDHPPPPPPPGFGPGPHGGRGGHHHRGGPPHHPRFHPHGPPPHQHPHGPPPHHRGSHHRGPSPPRGPGGPGFDFSQFMNDLGARIGMDLSGAAEELGLSRFMPSNRNSTEVDFEPKSDIFDLPTQYIVHVSLPGAKKPDLGVDWDGEHSALRIAGVVYRPEVNEDMLAHLAVDGRKRETGVFEKMIRLGTRTEPAVVDVAAIRARMADGVLIVTVPKIERGERKREVSIEKSETPSPVREVRQKEKEKEKEIMFDADRDMIDLTNEPAHEIQMVDQHSNSEKGKAKENEMEVERERSATVEAEEQQEPLPAYNPVEHHDGSDWEHFGSDEEGEYVKINVD